jgi:hypothetical protein
MTEFIYLVKNRDSNVFMLSTQAPPDNDATACVAQYPIDDAHNALEHIISHEMKQFTQRTSRSFSGDQSQICVALMKAVVEWTNELDKRKQVLAENKRREKNKKECFAYYESQINIKKFMNELRDSNLSEYINIKLGGASLIWDAETQCELNNNRYIFELFNQDFCIAQFRLFTVGNNYELIIYLGGSEDSSGNVLYPNYENLVKDQKCWRIGIGGRCNKHYTGYLGIVNKRDTSVFIEQLIHFTSELIKYRKSDTDKEYDYSWYKYFSKEDKRKKDLLDIWDKVNKAWAS